MGVVSLNGWSTIRHDQVHQRRKLAMVQTLLPDEGQIDKDGLSLELALTVKLRHHFPSLPDEIMMPYLENGGLWKPSSLEQAAT